MTRGAVSVRQGQIGVKGSDDADAQEKLDTLTKAVEALAE